MFQLDLKSRKSIYEQVVDNMKRLIISGVMAPDEKLPSVRELSKILTVNPNTIQKAYRELEYQGFVYTMSGLGTFVATPKDEPVSEDKINEIKDICRHAIKEAFYLGMSYEQIKIMLKELFEEGSSRS